MERFFGIALFLMIISAVFHLLITLVFMPIIKLFSESKRLKR